MTTPAVPHRIEFSVEVPGTPEQVWDAIATAGGISSWFLPTDVDEREGGAIVAHMGDTDSPGTVTGWDPPRRLVYEEPEWAALGGQADAVVTPLVSEFLVEAQSGGTCVVRVVSSAFGTGADWEREGFEQMAKHWRPYFEHHLRLYLARFAGQRATTLELDRDVPGQPDAVRQAMEVALGVTEPGRAVDALGLKGEVERMGDPYVVISVTDPVPGYLSLFAMDKGDGVASAQVAAWLFGDDAPRFVDEATPSWRSWLDELAVADAAPPAPPR
jgi:uncharacterized protein YndB with AHSA1/START domain